MKSITNTNDNNKKKKLSLTKQSAIRCIRRSIQHLNKNSKYHNLCSKRKISIEKKMTSVAEVPSTELSTTRTPSKSSRILQTPRSMAKQTNSQISNRLNSKIPLKTPNQLLTPTNRFLNNVNNSAKTNNSAVKSLFQNSLMKTPSSALNRPQVIGSSARNQVIPSRTPARTFQTPAKTPVSRLNPPKTPLSARPSGTNLSNRLGAASKIPSVVSKQTINSTTPSNKLLNPLNDKKISRTIDCAKSIKRRSIKILNQSSSRLSFLNDMESGCFLMTPKAIRQLINSANKIEEQVQEDGEQKQKENELKKQEEEEPIKVHAIKPTCLLKYLFPEKRIAEAKAQIEEPKKEIQTSEKEPIKVEILIKIKPSESQDKLQISLQKESIEEEIIESKETIKIDIPEIQTNQVMSIETTEKLDLTKEISSSKDSQVITLENELNLITEQTKEALTNDENKSNKDSQILTPENDLNINTQTVKEDLTDENLSNNSSQNEQNSENTETPVEALAEKVSQTQKVEINSNVNEKHLTIEEICHDSNLNEAEEEKIEEKSLENENVKEIMTDDEQDETKSSSKEAIIETDSKKDEIEYQKEVSPDKVEDNYENKEETCAKEIDEYEENNMECKEISIQTDFDEESMVQLVPEPSKIEEAKETIQVEAANIEEVKEKEEPVQVEEKESEPNIEEKETEYKEEEQVELEIKSIVSKAKAKRGRKPKIQVAKIVEEQEKQDEIRPQEHDENLIEEVKTPNTKGKRARKLKQTADSTPKANDESTDRLASSPPRILTRAQRAKLTLKN